MTNLKSSVNVIVPSHNVFDFNVRSKVWRKVEGWNKTLKRTTQKPLENAHRLQKLEKTSELSPMIVDAYTESILLRYTRIELSFILVFLFATILSGIAAMSNSTFFIITIVTGWFVTIAYRAYRHHINCYWFIRTLNSNKCPHCGMSLTASPRNIDLPITIAKH
jgi:hypothetical protein